jgi:hypothetical protein
MRRAQMILFSVLAGMLSSGCALGPSAIQASRVPYNEVIQRTTSEQLLLNLVRLRYREAPLFLEVGNVTTQFTFSQSAGVDGTINENVNVEVNNPDVLELGAGFGYEEKPTISYNPLQGEEFVQRMLTPVELDTLVLLMSSGWNFDRVMRSSVLRMNGCDNASRASGPTPQHAPRYERFNRVATLFRELQWHGQLQIVREKRSQPLAPPVPAERVSASDLVEAASKGYRFEPDSDGRLVLCGDTTALVWRIPPGLGDSPEVREIQALLALKPAASYDIRLAHTLLNDSAQRPAEHETIDLMTRSVMGTLFYLSHGVKPPAAHVKDGLITTTEGVGGAPFDWSRVTDELLHVQAGALPPHNAAVAARYRGYWYWIDDSDLDSKSTFSYLSQLFALRAGHSSGPGISLTLPVGN